MKIYIIFILFSSFLTFFVAGRQDPKPEAPCFPQIGNSCVFGSYAKPTGLYWDENYHVASANRYLRGEYFMEYHPPLGKLLIALGEKIFNRNGNLDTKFVSGFSEKACVDGACYAKDACPKDKSCNNEKTAGNEQDSIPYISSLDIKFKEGYTPVNGEVANYDFVGVRFFPVIFAWLCAILIFYLIFLLTKNHHVSFVFALGYVFDNAIIVHSRGAMLDGIQLFFVLASLVYLIKSFQTNSFKLKNYIILGLLIGLVVATKVNGLILAPLVFILSLREFFILPQQTQNHLKSIGSKFIPLFLISFVLNFIASKFLLSLKSVKDVTDPVVLDQIGIINGQRSLGYGVFLVLTTAAIFYFGNKIINNYFIDKNTVKTKIGQNWLGFSDFLISISTKIMAFAISLVFVFGFVFFIHFNIATKIIGNNTFGKYTSDATKTAIKNGTTGSLVNLIPQIKDSIYYISESQKGVPSFDPTKGDNEAGSLPVTWPIGNHAIRYYASAYSKCDIVIAGQPCQNIRYTSYLYLIANLSVWLIVLIGVILSIALILSRFVFGYKIPEDRESKEGFWWISLFTLMYVAYMVSVMQIERVMYLYHYFLPLTFGLIGSAVLFNYFFKNKNKIIMAIVLALIAILIFVNFIYFAPFSYQLDLTEESFEARKWLKYWGLFYYK